MAPLAFALCFIAGLAGAVILVLHGHPWFGAGLMFGTLSLRVTWRM